VNLGLVDATTFKISFFKFCIAVNRIDTHNHPTCSFNVRRGLVLKEIHKRVQENPTLPVRRVYDDVIQIDSGDSDDCPTFSNVRSRAKRFRSKFMPAIPRTIQDVVVDGDWAKTWKGRKFLTYQDNNMGLAVFTTKRLLKALQKADCLYVDGTFRTAPRPYQQFLTIHGKLNGFVVPMVFVLMTGKTSFQYRRVFAHVKQQVLLVTRQPLTATKVVCDFEKSLHIAVHFEFPRAKLLGCHFHFGQSLWRKIQKVGLSANYDNDRCFKKTIRKFMSMGFLPSLLVRQNFGLLRNCARVQRLINTYPRLDNWLDYVDTIYVNRNALFPPATWNVFDRDRDTRTNNHVEGEWVPVLELKEC
jgi:MULE transposase domain